MDGKGAVLTQLGYESIGPALLILGYTVFRAATVALMVVIVVSSFHVRTRLDLRKLLDARELSTDTAYSPVRIRTPVASKRRGKTGYADEDSSTDNRRESHRALLPPSGHAVQRSGRLDAGIRRAAR